ncbi:hypothetical protein [Rhodococcoides fascians]|nr:hypothetical protein [Rhodococcus fascians]MDQ0283175.1 hypothetical protein [Rhodococcus fascians]
MIARSRYADFRGGLGDDGESMRGSDGSASDGVGSNDYGVDSGE